MVHSLNGRDAILISVTVGILAIFNPWWDGMPSFYTFYLSPWLPALGVVLYICGTILNLRDPMGMIGQVAGITLFLIGVYNDDNFYGWLWGHGPGLGLYLAALSATLCFLILVFGGYKGPSRYQ